MNSAAGDAGYSIRVNPKGEVIGEEQGATHAPGARSTRSGSALTAGTI